MTSIDAPSPRLHEHAAENLRFIRDTMARAANFTAVPGLGGVLMGVLAFAAAIVAGPPRDTRAWLGVWLHSRISYILSAWSEALGANGLPVTTRPGAALLPGQ